MKISEIFKFTSKFRCLKSCKCGIQRAPTYKEILVQNTCHSICNLECMEIEDFSKQAQCYSHCGCKCNKVCLESCEGLKDDLVCKLNCGCIPSKDEIINKKTKSTEETTNYKTTEVKTPYQTQEKKETES